MQLLAQVLLPLAGPGPQVKVDVLLVAAAAARDHQQLTVDYVDHRGATTRRLLEPHRVVRAADRWYLLAWDVNRGAWRTLRLDRLTPETPPGRRFTPHPMPDADATALVADAITTNPYPVTCRLTVFAPAAVVGDLIGPTRGRIRIIDEGSCEVTGGSVSLTEMAWWVIRLGFEVTVHEPPELIDTLNVIHQRLGKIIKDSTARRD